MQFLTPNSECYPPIVELVEASRSLCKSVDALRFRGPVACVYNPLGYARRPHEAYLSRYGKEPRRALFLGMNPGPWGMAQTGVPFGEVAMVRDWLGIAEKVDKPKREHPKRPIEGFDCARSEVSGRRLWGWAKERFRTPAKFFAEFFVVNYCPLVFMDEGGRNLTPDKLPAAESAPLSEVCDEALRRQVEHFRAEWVVGVGAFAAQRAESALRGTSVRIGQILHPSPASPAANRGWAAQAESQLKALGLL